MWGVVVCFNWCARRLLVWTRPAKISFDDLRIAVTPITFYRLRTVRRAKIDHCVRFARRNAGRCFRGDANANGCKQEYQTNNSEPIHWLPPLIAATMLSAP